MRLPSELTAALAQIKAQGFVKSRRKGNTGVGYTLETLLGIKENNLSLPDLGTVELKAQRQHSEAKITLFTFNRAAWQLQPQAAILAYGGKNKNGRLGLYATLTVSANERGLRVEVSDDAVVVVDSQGTVIVQWPLQELSSKFAEKVGNLLLVKATVKKENGTEYFHYVEAKLLSGSAEQATKIN